jgi:hypothetical protein
MPDLKPGIYVIESGDNKTVKKYDRTSWLCFGTRTMSFRPQGKILAGPFTAEEILEKMALCHPHDVDDFYKDDEDEEKAKTCTWKEDEDGIWSCSDCDVVWSFLEAGPKENHVNFCPRCGAKITKVEAWKEEVEKMGGKS